MKKIPTVLVRNPDDRAHVLPEITPGCEWVLAGEGIPTRKYDGTCCMLDADGWWARREVKPGKQAPPNFRVEHHDDTTGKTQGWVPIGESAFARWHAEALAAHPLPFYEHGTYELIGPKINGNPEAVDSHWLIAHASAMVLRSILDLNTPAELLTFARWAEADEGYEGIVWHHPDGRMAKLKGRDVPREVTA